MYAIKTAPIPSPAKIEQAIKDRIKTALRNEMHTCNHPTDTNYYCGLHAALTIVDQTT